MDLFSNKLSLSKKRVAALKKKDYSYNYENRYLSSFLHEFIKEL
jgi:hypothetical protein